MPPPAKRLLRSLPAFVACLPAILSAQSATPSFNRNASVHDPSVLRVGNYHYVFGSHLASARTTDLMNWTQLSTSPTTGNALVPDPATEFAEAIAWSGSSDFWAPDVHQLSDGRYYFYYCTCQGDAPRSALGIAVSDSAAGPYTNVGIILKSGMWGEASPDGTIYDATKHPNAVDPAVFEDASGNLWMVYGSYSGGIFIMQLDPTTGMPRTSQGYGKRLIGRNHSRIEGPYILYSPETHYYYLFLSFGGLASDGGYQVREARSTSPNGPYYDPAGNNLTNVGGADGTFFDDTAIAPYGAKITGNYQFLHVDGEPRTTSRGYLSPGHNSATYDGTTGRYLMFFHTRFVGRGEQHEVRVHQMYMTADGWLVVAPHRYAQEAPVTLASSQIPGQFKLINLAKDISADLHTSTLVTLAADGTVTGSATGSWSLSGDRYATLVLDGVTYRGVFSRQWDDDNQVWVLAFSALSTSGVTVWGSKVAAPNTAPTFAATAPQSVDYGDTLQLTLTASDPDYEQTLTYSLVEAPVGAVIDAGTGVLTWAPSIADAGTTRTITVRVTDNGADPAQTDTSFVVTVNPTTVMHRLGLDFTSSGASGLRDAAGQYTGLTARLPGTGASVPTADPLLALSTTAGTLSLTTTQSDFNGSAGLATNRSIGVALSSLGYTGSQDFSVTAVFGPITGLGTIDQVGVFAGANATTLTRAGTIIFTNPERYAVNTQSGTDVQGHFTDPSLDITDGLTVTLLRQGGTWRAFIDGVEWSPAAAPAFLDAYADLTVGVFAITPFNSTAKTVQLQSFNAVVDTGEPLYTPLESWRMAHFGSAEATGDGANAADPDGDGLPNLLEYALGASPTVASAAHAPAPGVTQTASGPCLTLTFNRVADPAITYTVEAANAVDATFSAIWSSAGTDNSAGTVTVTDTAPITASACRFLRLRVSR